MIKGRHTAESEIVDQKWQKSSVIIDTRALGRLTQRQTESVT